MQADQIKNNTDTAATLSSAAIAVTRRRAGSDDSHVFLYRGKQRCNIYAGLMARAGGFPPDSAELYTYDR